MKNERRIHNFCSSCGYIVAAIHRERDRSKGFPVNHHQTGKNTVEFDDAKNGPYFDKAASKNITALLGKTAYLTCRVKNLGNKTVSNATYIYILLYSTVVHILRISLLIFVVTDIIASVMGATSRYSFTHCWTLYIYVRSTFPGHSSSAFGRLDFTNQISATPWYRNLWMSGTN